MLRALFALIGNIILIPINIVLLIPRLLYKMIIDHKAGLWITTGGKKKIIEAKGDVKIR